MPFLRPDVIKLDLQLIQDRPDLAVAEIMSAVSAYSERSGATILAEGIETVQHITTAPHFYAALIADDLGDSGPDAERRFDYILTYDPALVTQMAAGLLARVLSSRTHETALV